MDYSDHSYIAATSQGLIGAEQANEQAPLHRILGRIEASAGAPDREAPCE